MSNQQVIRRAAPEGVEERNFRPLLDHGHVILRNIAGPTRRRARRWDADSIDPANAARMSFGQADSGRTREQDLKLVKYLLNHDHLTPIEMVETWWEMALPIMVARQFVRHRAACINEISGRYVELIDNAYVPVVIGGKPVGGAKQGQSDTLGPEVQEWVKRDMEKSHAEAFARYKRYLEAGVAPEHARIVLPVGTYTKWLFKMDLRNLFGFLRLRLDSHAQVEAQVFAHAILSLLLDAVPDIMEIGAGIAESVAVSPAQIQAMEAIAIEPNDDIQRAVRK